MQDQPARLRPAGGTDAPPERAGLRWLYGLVALPMLTDIAETGRLPSAAREWVTEVIAGLAIAALIHRVRSEHRAVLALARTDGLTGLGNRRAFEDAVEDECARARRGRLPLCRVYFDIDHFKQPAAVVQRIRDHCTHAGLAWQGGPLGLSAGIAEFDGSEPAAEFGRRSDAAMVRQKAAGRA